MTLVHRIPKTLMFVAGVFAVYYLFALLHMIGSAHAQGAPTATPATASVSWDVVLLGVIAVLSGIRTILVFVAPRTKTTKDDDALALFNRLLELAQPPRTPVPLPVKQDGFAKLGVMLALSGVAVAALATSGCAQAPAVRERATVGAGAFLDCQAPNVSALAQDMVPFVVATIKSWISGSGHPDSAGIRHDAAKVATMAGQCAWDAAMAILTTPQPTLDGAPQSEAQAMSVRELSTTWRAVRADLAWAPAH